jgi:hypothetical protein
MLLAVATLYRLTENIVHGILRQATELSIPMQSLCTVIGIAVIVTIREHNAVAISIAVH